MIEAVSFKIVCAIFVVWLTTNPISCSSAFCQEAVVSPTPITGAVEKVTPRIYRIGQVTLNKLTKQVWFPAFVNQSSGSVEYLLVGNKGKRHESVFRTGLIPCRYTPRCFCWVSRP